MKKTTALSLKYNLVARKESNRAAQEKKAILRNPGLRVREGCTRKKKKEEEEEGVPWGPLLEGYLCSRYHFASECKPPQVRQEKFTEN